MGDDAGQVSPLEQPQNEGHSPARLPRNADLSALLGYERLEAPQRAASTVALQVEVVAGPHLLYHVSPRFEPLLVRRIVNRARWGAQPQGLIR